MTRATWASKDQHDSRPTYVWLPLTVQDITHPIHPGWCGNASPSDADVLLTLRQVRELQVI